MSAPTLQSSNRITTTDRTRLQLLRDIAEQPMSSCQRRRTVAQLGSCAVLLGALRRLESAECERRVLGTIDSIIAEHLARTTLADLEGRLRLLGAVS